MVPMKLLRAALDADGAWHLEDTVGGAGITYSMGITYDQHDIRLPDGARRADDSHKVIREAGLPIAITCSQRLMATTHNLGFFSTRIRIHRWTKSPVNSMREPASAPLATAASRSSNDGPMAAQILFRSSCQLAPCRFASSSSKERW